ncbi:MAG: inositol monophosphatase family protein [Propionibacteriaceae bacterium]
MVILTLPTPETCRSLMDIATQVALRCGQLIVSERPEHLMVATKSSAVDVVTIMDRRSEELAATLLSQARPDDGQFGEEGLNRPGTSGITWVVDPLDGTVNYLYELPAYCVSVAAVVGDPQVAGAWRPAAGAVYNPVTSELWHAALGAGATKNTQGAAQELHFCPAASLAQSLIATGFSYDSTVRAEQGTVVAQLVPLVRDIRRLGSAALDLCRVADGQVDAYYERMLNPWDIAAGWLIATEAGALVEGHSSLPSKELLIAGSSGIITQLRALVT